MNRFGYRETSVNGLSFELLIDGEFIGGLVGGEKGGIPYWVIEDDLPSPGEGSTGRRIVSVCGCGEWGCGHTSCRVEVEGGLVRLREFRGVVAKPGAEFAVSADEYRRVVAEIAEKAEGRRASER